MNIVLMEGLGVDKAFLDEQAAKLEKMGHTFTVYEKKYGCICTKRKR